MISAATPFPQVPLAALLNGHAPDLPLNCMDRFLTGRVSEPPPTLIDTVTAVDTRALTRLNARLLSCHPSSEAAETARSAYLQLIDRAIFPRNSPSRKEIDACVRDQLCIPREGGPEYAYPSGRDVTDPYFQLDEVAIEGMYLLLMQGRVYPITLKNYLRHPELFKRRLLVDIFRGVTLLYQLGLENFGNMLIPIGNKDHYYKSFSFERATNIQFRQHLSMMLASRVANVTRIVLNDYTYKVKLAPEQLGEDERQLLNQLSLLSDDVLNTIQKIYTFAEAHLSLSVGNDVWLIEGKPSLSKEFDPSLEQTARILLKVVRYGLAQRIYGLKGVCFFYCSEDLHPDFERVLLKTLNQMGVRYVIYILDKPILSWDSQSIRQARVIQNTDSPLQFTNHPLPTQRTRPLPLIVKAA